MAPGFLPVPLAHQGGWDEAAILLGPVIVYLVIRYMGRQEPPEPPGADATGGDPEPRTSEDDARSDDSDAREPD